VYNFCHLGIGDLKFFGCRNATDFVGTAFSSGSVVPASDYSCTWNTGGRERVKCLELNPFLVCFVEHKFHVDNPETKFVHLV
jgi:hypothetical protein